VGRTVIERGSPEEEARKKRRILCFSEKSSARRGVKKRQKWGHKAKNVGVIRDGKVKQFLLSLRRGERRRISETTPKLPLYLRTRPENCGEKTNGGLLGKH